MIGQNAPVSSVEAVLERLDRMSARLSELERLRGVVVAPSGVYNTATSVPTGTATALALTDISDPAGWLSGGDVVPTVPGRYLITAAVNWQVALGGTRHFVAVRKNGADLTTGLDNRPDMTAGTVNDVNHVSTVAVMNGTTDAIDVRAFQTSGVNRSPALVLTVQLLPGH